jgi:hypothetical protein
MEKSLSRSARRLFWDMDVDSLDLYTHRKTIIERIVNDGTLADWRWLRATYGPEEIKRTLESGRLFKRNAVRMQSRRLASLILT